MTVTTATPIGDATVDTALAVEHVTVRFGGLLALDDVTLRAATGEIVGLIGPNGAGKTTLLNVITGIIRPNVGQVTLAGRPCTHSTVHKRARLGLARTFQRVTLFNELSVRQHVELAAQAPVGLVGHRGDADGSNRDDADGILERVGLHVDGDADVAGLPLGRARLVELAMALAARPKVLLLDEPFSGLGTSEREHLSALLNEIKGEQRMAIVLVEHDVDIVTRIADRVVVLDFGHVIGDGSPDVVLADPAVRMAYFGMAGLQ